MNSSKRNSSHAAGNLGPAGSVLNNPYGQGVIDNYSAALQQNYHKNQEGPSG